MECRIFSRKECLKNHILINLECYVNNDNILSRLSSNVRPILITLTELKSTPFDYSDRSLDDFYGFRICVDKLICVRDKSFEALNS